MLRRVRSFAIGAIIVVLILGLAPVAGSQQAGCAEPGAVTPMKKNWDKIAPPRFFLDPQGMTDLAVDPIEPNQMFVTNNKEVMASKDGGCTWVSVYQDPTALKIFMEATGPGWLVLAVERAQGVSIEVSKDSGKSWTPSVDSQQRFLGYWTHSTVYSADRGPLASSPSDPKTMYLALFPPATIQNEGFHLVFASKDGGITWEQRSDLATALQEFAGRYGGPITWRYLQLYVDPLNPDDLWALGRFHGGFGLRFSAHGFLAHSTDGGRSWQETKRINGWPFYDDISIRHDEGSPPAITMTSTSKDECQQPDFGCLMFSPDAGLTWSTLPSMVGFTPRVIEAGRDPNRLITFADSALGGTWVHRFDARRRIWVDITPPDGVQYPTGIAASNEGKKAAYFFLHRLAIDRYTGKV